MKSIKAIVVGGLFILVALCLLGLVYIFMAVAYNALSVDYPFLNDITGLFRYLVGIPVFMATFFAGGYITAHMANTHANISVLFHCLTMGVITVCGMMYSGMEYSGLTLTGIVVIILSLSAASAGGFYWLRAHKESTA